VYAPNSETQVSNASVGSMSLSVSSLTVSGPFSLACVAAVSNAVEITLGGVPSSTGGKTSILAKFTPHGGLTLEAAAKACGLKGFDFQSTVNSVPSPSPYYQIGNPVALTGPFNDPSPS